MNYIAPFDTVREFSKGNIITFDARVGKYFKGFFGTRIEDRMNHPMHEDFRLKYPHNVRKMGIRDRECTSTFTPGLYTNGATEKFGSR